MVRYRRRIPGTFRGRKRSTAWWRRYAERRWRKYHGKRKRPVYKTKTLGNRQIGFSERFKCKLIGQGKITVADADTIANLHLQTNAIYQLASGFNPPHYYTQLMALYNKCYVWRTDFYFSFVNEDDSAMPTQVAIYPHVDNENSIDIEEAITTKACRGRFLSSVANDRNVTHIKQSVRTKKWLRRGSDMADFTATAAANPTLGPFVNVVLDRTMSAVQFITKNVEVVVKVVYHCVFMQREDVHSHAS